MQRDGFSKARDISILLAALAIFALATSGALYIWSLRSAHETQEAERVADELADKDRQQYEAEKQKRGGKDMTDLMQDWTNMKWFSDRARQSTEPDAAQMANQVDAEMNFEQELLSKAMGAAKNDDLSIATPVRFAIEESRKRNGFAPVMDSIRKNSPTTMP